MSVNLDIKYVYRGVWVDLSRGEIMGKTITTDTSTGNLLVALLAVMVTLGTNHLWHLISFAVHQLRANGQATDGLFRQQQALLRTLPTPGTVLADSIKLWWAWRKNTKRPFLRSLVLIVLAIFTTVGTISASIFSSFVVDSSDLTVLVKSPFCGAYDPVERLSRSGSYPYAVTGAASKYGPQCYGDFGTENITFGQGCNAFINRYIDFNVSREACPFEKGMCVPDRGGEAFAMDSVLLDANKQFGLNLPADSEVQFRRKVTCSVLSLKNRTRVYNLTDLRYQYGRDEFLPGEKIMSIRYGTTGNGKMPDNSTQMTSLQVANWTFKYDISGHIWYTNRGLPVPSSVDLIPELRRADGDTGLKTIGLNGIRYLKPVDDPLFSAHKPNTAQGISDSGEIRPITVYAHDSPLKAIGCLQQYQFCHVRSGQDNFCSDLAGLPANVTEVNFPDANDLQRAAIRLFVNTSYTFDSVMPTSPFLINKLILPPTSTIATAPEEGQWYVELAGWERSVWASLQIAIADWAIGPAVRESFEGSENWARPSSPAEKQLCGMQKMKISGNVVNINVFALAFIIGFSTFVMIIDIALLKFLIYLSKFRQALAPRIDRWIQDGTWQLQRRAYEGEGYCHWKNLETEIPVTEKGGQLFGDFSNRHDRHSSV